jgi:predicted transcriptional regulator
MKLHRKIFKVIEDNLEFLLYLYEHPEFTLAELCDKFEFSYQALYNHLTEWESQGYIVKEKQPPKLGGLKFKYMLSDVAKKRIEKISNDLYRRVNG